MLGLRSRLAPRAIPVHFSLVRHNGADMMTYARQHTPRAPITGRAADVEEIGKSGCCDGEIDARPLDCQQVSIIS